MIKKILLSFFLLYLICLPAQAATWYIRSDGGTNTQCTGLTDAAYPGSGAGQSCALNHPFQGNRYVTDDGAGRGGTQLFQGGDTIIVGKSDGAGGSTDQFEMGYGTVAWPGCGNTFTYGCYMDSLPSGTDAAHPTKWLGRGYDTGCVGHKVQLWGTRGTRTVMSYRFNNYQDLECVDITDHSTCAYGSPIDNCDSTNNTGPWARRGIWFASNTNVDIKHVDVHGIADRGIFLFKPAGVWNISYFNIVGVGSAGVDQDDGGTSDDSWNGILNIDHMKLDWSGCHEKYPLVATLASISNVVSGTCSSQGQGMFTDGWGMGDGHIGTINMVDSEIMHNTQDGFDCQHCAGGGVAHFSRIHAEGNSGMQIKLNVALATIENSVIIGNCNYFNASGGNPLTNTTTISSPGQTYDNVCRGPGGEPIALANSSGGQQTYIYNNTIGTNAVAAVLINNTSSPNCDVNSKWVSRNNIYIGGMDPLRSAQSNLFYNDGSGGCIGKQVDSDYDLVYNMIGNVINSNGVGAIGAHDRYSDPLITGYSTLQMNTYPYYEGADALGLVALQGTSVARFTVSGANSANQSLTFSTFGTSDFYSISRGSAWDGGAIQFAAGSACTPNSGTCSSATDCCGGSCCVGSCSSSSCQTPPTTNFNNFYLNGSLGR